MIHAAAAERQWRATSHAGVEACVLHQNGQGGGAALVRFAAGARFPRHDHPGGEEVYVLEGRCVVGGATLVAGDFLWTPPGEVHDLHAEHATVIYVATPSGVRILE
jgi:quercetin dioxygenase-like cupin family protein